MSVINASTPAVVTDRSIVDVLHRAHQTAEAVHGPDEARAILHVAELFADELAKTDPHFNRLHFIQAITRDPA
jgi:hypothetical protein